MMATGATDANFIRERITGLRMKKGVSEYKMSLDLGHNKGYIQSISSGRALPSMTEFLAICEYLNILPKDFFDSEEEYPVQFRKYGEILCDMTDEDWEVLLPLLKRMIAKH